MCLPSPILSPFLVSLPAPHPHPQGSLASHRCWVLSQSPSVFSTASPAQHRLAFLSSPETRHKRVGDRISSPPSSLRHFLSDDEGGDEGRARYFLQMASSLISRFQGGFCVLGAATQAPPGKRDDYSTYFGSKNHPLTLFFLPVTSTFSYLLKAPWDPGIDGWGWGEEGFLYPAIVYILLSWSSLALA